MKWSHSKSLTLTVFVICVLLSSEFVKCVHSDELSSTDDADYNDEGESEVITSPSNSSSLPPVSSASASTSTSTSTTTTQASNEESDEGEDEGDEEVIDSSKDSSHETFAKEGESLSKLQKFMLEGVETMIKQTLPTVVQSGLETNVSSECANSLLSLVSALRDSQIWAFRSKSFRWAFIIYFQCALNARANWICYWFSSNSAWFIRQTAQWNSRGHSHWLR